MNGWHRGAFPVHVPAWAFTPAALLLVAAVFMAAWAAEVALDPRRNPKLPAGVFLPAELIKAAYRPWRPTSNLTEEREVNHA